MKTCICCGTSKHETQFPVNSVKGAIVERRARCRPCASMRLHQLAKKRAAQKNEKPKEHPLAAVFNSIIKGEFS